jgi:hypothetical protein
VISYDIYCLMLLKGVAGDCSLRGQELPFRRSVLLTLSWPMLASASLGFLF